MTVQNTAEVTEQQHLLKVNPLNPTGLETGLPETLYTRKAGIPAHIHTIITMQTCIPANITVAHKGLK